MSKINLNNYEAFMLDHLEGNLSIEDVRALKLFAALHPELELNFDEELVTLEDEKISFGGKQNLKAGFSDELVIGYLENILVGAEKTQAGKLAASNAVFKHELELYKKTIVIAEADIIFENKEKLKRRGAVIFFQQNNSVRVAAALLLLFGLWFMVTRLIGDASGSATKEIELAKKEISPINTGTISNNTSNNDNIVIAKEEEKLVAKNSVVKNNDTVAKKQNEINTGTVNVVVPENKEEPQLADRDPKDLEPFVKRDTNAVLMANTNSSQEKLIQKFIIEEGEDDEPVATKPKGRLWNLASGVFKGLNKRGIENVNSTENNNEILIGALTISKPN